MIHGLLWKVCSNRDGIYGPNDYDARKPAGLEILHCAAMLQFRRLGLYTPLICAVDFKGVRLSCQTVVPIDDSTLVMGSTDAGANVVDRDPDARAILAHVGRVLGLAAHVSGTATRSTIVGPADVEIHRGKDGRLYAIDLHRLFPPSSDEKYRFLVQLLRPEFMVQCWAPRDPTQHLSSDVYSGFSSPADPQFRQHEQNARRAVNVLRQTCIPEWCARRPLPRTHDALVEDMHRAGINVRFLGLLYQNLATEPAARQLVSVEMAARMLKRRIVNAHAAIAKRLTGNAAYVEVVRRLFNDTPMEQLCEAARGYFGAGLQRGQPAPGEVPRGRVLARAVRMCGVVLGVAEPLGDEHVFALGDIRDVRPVLKTVARSQWALLVNGDE